MIRVRPGIILITICEEYILVSSSEVRQYCPYTMIINDTGAVIWDCLANGLTIPEIMKKLEEVFDIPSGTDIEGAVREYIEMLHSNGYLIYEEDMES